MTLQWKKEKAMELEECKLALEESKMALEEKQMAALLQSHDKNSPRPSTSMHPFRNITDDMSNIPEVFEGHVVNVDREQMIVFDKEEEIDYVSN